MKIKTSDLTKAMRKVPSHKLWDKLLKNWDKKDYLEFEKILNSDIDNPNKKKRLAVNAMKVIRVSDGFIYNSIEECRIENRFHKTKMREKLSEGNEFKKL